MPNANPNTIFTCSKCGAQFSKWSGRCLECGSWGTVEKQITTSSISVNINKAPIALKQLDGINSSLSERIKTNRREIDRVFGGGIVPGSLTLLGGEPGIGKSTIALQIASEIPETIYFSAEESEEQIKLRADRIFSKNQKIIFQIGSAYEVETILATILDKKPRLVIIDSIQTIYSEEANGEPGSVSQIKTCTVKLLEVAKKENIAMIIIGHVTKDGAVAGPKTLEHLVDTVLYFEGDHRRQMRILRAVKNRFGSTDEVGIFDMDEKGLQEVTNPSLTLTSENYEKSPGSVLACIMEGTRPIILEIQALVSKTSFGYPVRKANGFDLNRLHLLIAVLQKRAKLNLAEYDVHINIVGGIEISEPAADLPVCLAIASAYKDKIISENLAAFGEVGLSGEVRRVPHTEKRIKECEQLGIKNMILPYSGKIKSEKIKILEIKNLNELIKQT